MLFGQPADDVACRRAILSVNKKATWSLTSWLQSGMCALKTRLKILFSDQTRIYRDLVAVRRGDEEGHGWLRKL